MLVAVKWEVYAGGSLARERSNRKNVFYRT